MDAKKGRSGRAQFVLSLVGTVVCLASCSGDDGPAGGNAGSSAGPDAASDGTGGAATSSTSAAGGTAEASASGGAGGSDTGDASCGGPVPTTVVDAHCASPDGGRGELVGPHDGNEADDDNCLFHVKMTVPCIARGQPVAVTLEMQTLGAMMPANGAAAYLEASVGSHVLPNTNTMTTENNGVYTMNPVIFDRMGTWLVTFHFYDAIPSMHSHVSFHVDVP